MSLADFKADWAPPGLALAWHTCVQTFSPSTDSWFRQKVQNLQRTSLLVDLEVAF